jgi:pimeloyl-ACP methyl ester carboxylesterase
MDLDRRAMMGVAPWALAGSTALPPAPAAAATSGVWPGVSVMRGGTRGYVTTPLSQVHYRVMGEGTPILLLHQTPWFSVQFAHAVPALAAAGFRALAPDRPGYGLSDAPAAPPTIDDYADDLIPVLDALGMDRPVVLGHHTGASVAAAFAVRHPGRTRALIMDGVPLYSEAERAERLARPHWHRWLEPDGKHIADRFAARAGRKSKDGEIMGLAGVQWSVLSFFLAGETEWYGHHAAFSYDMEAALKAVDRPTLLISHSDDVLHPSTLRAAALRPDFALKEFAGGSSQVIFDDPGPWAATVAGFVKTL